MRVPESRKAALHRDGALRRLRRTTQISVLVSLALGSGFAALAAGSTHAKKLVRTPVRRAATTTVRALTSAPAPPLVAVQGASQAAPPPSPSPPAAAPAPTYQQPAVVSGGS